MKEILLRQGKQVSQTLRNFYYRVFGSVGYGKFVVITRSRTGSTLLRTLLNSNPFVTCGGEIFASIGTASCSRIWKNFFSHRPARTHQLGFKIFYYHPLGNKDKSVWALIKSDPTIKIIHLTRVNTLRTLVSRKIAGKTDIWSTRSRVKKVKLEDKRISLTPEECLAEFEKVKKWEDSVAIDFVNHKVLPITYEELSADQQEAATRIFRFLEVPDFPVRTGLVKQNNESLEELIENFEELRAAFADSYWERFFCVE